jgi:glycogen synthase
VECGGHWGLALLDLIDQVGIPWVFHLMDQVPTYLLTEVVPTVAALFCKNDRALLAHARVISMSDQILTEIVETAGIHFENSPAIIPGWVDGHDLVPRVKYLEQGRLRLMAAGSLGLHKGHRHNYRCLLSAAR